MSANNQTLIKEYEGKFYVFENVNAESWLHYDYEKGIFDDSRINELPLSAATESFDNRDEAFNCAWKVDRNETEYGVQFTYLCKDGADVKIIAPKLP